MSRSAASLGRHASAARPQEDLRFTTFVVEHAADIVFWMAADGALLYANQHRAS